MQGRKHEFYENQSGENSQFLEPITLENHNGQKRPKSSKYNFDYIKLQKDQADENLFSYDEENQFLDDNDIGFGQITTEELESYIPKQQQIKYMQARLSDKKGMGQKQIGEEKQVSKMTKRQRKIKQFEKYNNNRNCSKNYQYRSQFADPTQQDICRAIEGLKCLLPHCSIERVVHELHKMLNPNTSKSIEFQKNLIKENLRMSEIQQYPNFQQPDEFNENLYKSQKYRNQYSSNHHLESSHHSYENSKKAKRFEEESVLISHSETKKESIYPASAKARTHHAGIQKWLKNFENTDISDKRFVDFRELAMLFVTMGPSNEIARKQIPKSPHLKTLHTSYRCVCRTAFRKLQNYMIKDLKIEVNLISKESLTYLSTNLLHCRKWMSNDSVRCFFIFVKMIYKIPLRKEQYNPQKQRVVRMHEEAINSLKKKMVHIRQCQQLKSKRYFPKKEEPFNLVLPKEEEEKSDHNSVDFSDVKDDIEIPEIYSESQDENDDPITNDVKMEYFCDPNLTKNLKNQYHIQGDQFYFEPRQKLCAQNGIWTEQLDRYFAELYIGSQRMSSVRQSMISAFGHLKSKLTVRQCKARMEKLVRLGLRKLHGAHTHYKKNSTDGLLPGMPPLMDSVTKYLLRSPHGQELRSTMLEFYIHDDPDKQYFRAALTELIRFIEANREEVVHHIENPYYMPRRRIRRTNEFKI